jgi:FG-GAP-like repeat
MQLIAYVCCVFPLFSQVKFSAPREITDYVNMPRDLHVVDMNEDGFKDIVCREQITGAVVWWQNNGSGQFPQRHLKESPGVEYYPIGFGDANSDGKPDMWFRKDGDQDDQEFLYIVYAQANGTYSGPVLVHPAWKHGRDMQIDANGDGLLDVYAYEYVFLQNADATFANAVAIGNIDANRNVVMGRFVPGWSDYQVAGFEGIRPALIENATSMVDLSPLKTSTRRLVMLVKVPAVDVNSLDELWVAVADKKGEDEIFTLLRLSFTSQGGYRIEKEIELPEPDVISERARYETMYVHATRDEQGLHFFVSTSELMCSVNLPTPDAPALITTMSSFTGKNSVAQFAHADLNADGVKELVIATSEIWGGSGPYFSQMLVMSLTASGVPTSNIVAINQGNLARKIIWTGDFDRDGDEDFIADGGPALDSPLGIFLWKNSGSGGGFTLIPLIQPGFRHHLLEVMDIDADGFTDLLVTGGTYIDYNTFYGSLHFYRNVAGARLQKIPFNNSNGTFVRNDVKYLDMNGDGFKDLIDSGYLQLLNSNREVMSIRHSLIGLNVIHFDVIDIDHDGDFDLYFESFLFSLTGYYNSFYSLNDGNGNFRSIALLGDGSPKLLRADLDGDGHRDFRDLEGYFLSRPGVNLIRPTWHSRLVGRDGAIESSFVDIDGDADVDHLNTYWYNGIHGRGELGWLENRGNELGVEPMYREVQAEGAAEITKVIAHRPLAPFRYFDPTSAAMIDIDGDGIRDLLVSSHSPFAVRRMEWYKVSKPVVPQLYDQWMNAYGRKGNLAGPHEDLDRDGNNNWSEYVFQSNPLISEPVDQSRPRISMQEGLLRVDYASRADVPDVVLQSSSDLTNWQDRATVESIVPGETILKQWSMVEPMSNGKKFYRVKYPEPDISQ